ncbi:hypothetical protein PspLS_00591, partial [Pyricularia sp. CBS 133598]
RVWIFLTTASRRGTPLNIQIPTCRAKKEVSADQRTFGHATQPTATQGTRTFVGTKKITDKMCKIASEP